jgi:hypothetical protein
LGKLISIFCQLDNIPTTKQSAACPRERNDFFCKRMSGVVNIYFEWLVNFVPVDQMMIEINKFSFGKRISHKKPGLILMNKFIQKGQSLWVLSPELSAKIHQQPGLGMENVYISF